MPEAIAASSAFDLKVKGGMAPVGIDVRCAPPFAKTREGWVTRRSVG